MEKITVYAVVLCINSSIYWYYVLEASLGFIGGEFCDGNVSNKSEF